MARRLTADDLFDDRSYVLDHIKQGIGSRVTVKATRLADGSVCEKNITRDYANVLSKRHYGKDLFDMDEYTY